MKNLIIIFIVLFCTGCSSQPQDFVLYQKGAVMPEIVVSDNTVQPVAEEFAELFYKATGQRLSIVTVKTAKAKSIISLELLDLKTEKMKGGFFEIKQVGESVSIAGSDIDQLKTGIRYFFTTYIGYDPSVNTTNHYREVVKISTGLSYLSPLSFEYREPYFIENFNPLFRQWHNTHTIEETWGLWGHNIGKAITPVPAMYAKAGGQVHEEQFCFSSPELEQALSAFITQKISRNPSQHKFMIMPNDNDIVCQCELCKAKGNTAKNASPAVFSLLNRLAAKFPEQQFFSTAYISTVRPPGFKLAPNAGVMISTMAFPKGVVIEISNRKAEIDETFTAWKNVCDRIYLWDYAINFDNYYEFYPTLSIAQKNLQYYKVKGVTGVFMQGSEDSYSVFSDLKCYVYAQLLKDPSTDVKQTIRRFFEMKYPSIAGTLSEYYLAIEARALASQAPFDIYGGIQQSYRKYLDDAELTALYNKIYAQMPLLPANEQQAVKPLLLALTFQRLEVMRVNAFEGNGYANYDYNTGIAAVKPETTELLTRLKELQSQTGLNVYNESGYRLSDYISMWENESINRQYKNLFYGKPFKVLSKLDEDYPRKGMLNDGNIGFQEYYNNWLLTTGEALKIEINADDVRKANTVVLSFLNSERHRIYLPKKVTVIIDGRKYEGMVTATCNVKAFVTIPVEIKPSDKKIVIEAIKQEAFTSRSIACDEIYFK